MAIGRLTATKASDQAPDASAEVMVWDRLVRVLHWSLVALFATAFITGDDFETPHQWAGYGVLGIVAVRIMWGVIGSAHARFRDFVMPPGRVINYARDLVLGRAPRYIGHNPLGGVMVVALLAMLLVISATGVALTIEPYRQWEWLKEAHELAANAALGLVGLHVAGVLLSSFLHGENLIRAMITGRKRGV